MNSLKHNEHECVCGGIYCNVCVYVYIQVSCNVTIILHLL